MTLGFRHLSIRRTLRTDSFEVHELRSGTLVGTPEVSRFGILDTTASGTPVLWLRLYRSSTVYFIFFTNKRSKFYITDGTTQNLKEPTLERKATGCREEDLPIQNGKRTYGGDIELSTIKKTLQSRVSTLRPKT